MSNNFNNLITIYSIQIKKPLTLNNLKNYLSIKPLLFSIWSSLGCLTLLKSAMFTYTVITNNSNLYLGISSVVLMCFILVYFTAILYGYIIWKIYVFPDSNYFCHLPVYYIMNTLLSLFIIVGLIISFIINSSILYSMCNTINFCWVLILVVISICYVNKKLSMCYSTNINNSDPFAKGVLQGGGKNLPSLDPNGPNKLFNILWKIFILSFLIYLLYNMEYNYAPVDGGYVSYISTIKLLVKINIIISIIDLSISLFVNYKLPIFINPNWDGHYYSNDNIRYYKWLFDLKLLIFLIGIIMVWLYKILVITYIKNNVIMSIMFFIVYILANIFISSGFVDGIKSQIYGKYIIKSLPAPLMKITKHRYYRYLFWLGVVYLPYVFYLLTYSDYKLLDNFYTNVLTFGIYYTTIWLFVSAVLNLTAFIYKLYIHLRLNKHNKKNVLNNRRYLSTAIQTHKIDSKH